MISNENVCGMGQCCQFEVAENDGTNAYLFQSDSTMNLVHRASEVILYPLYLVKKMSRGSVAERRRLGSTD